MDHLTLFYLYQARQYYCPFVYLKTIIETPTAVQTRGDSEVIHVFCSQLLSKPLTCTLHLS